MTIQTTEIKDFNFSDMSSDERTDCYITFKCVCGEEIGIVDYESEFCKACKRFCYYEKGKAFCDEVEE